MKLSKAIRIKENYLEIHSGELEGERLEADLLSIIALKRFELARRSRLPASFSLLPGETLE